MHGFLLALALSNEISLSYLTRIKQLSSFIICNRPLSINGTKNNAEKSDQRRRIDQASVTLLECAFLRHPEQAEGQTSYAPHVLSKTLLAGRNCTRRDELPNICYTVR